MQGEQIYAPELVAVGGAGLLLRGFEASEGVGYVQEWRCLLEAPAVESA